MNREYQLIAEKYKAIYENTDDDDIAAGMDEVNKRMNKKFYFFKLDDQDTGQAYQVFDDTDGEIGGWSLDEFQIGDEGESYASLFDKDVDIIVNNYDLPQGTNEGLSFYVSDLNNVEKIYGYLRKGAKKYADTIQNLKNNLSDIPLSQFEREIHPHVAWEEGPEY
jgi:hypothetical protein